MAVSSTTLNGGIFLGPDVHANRPTTALGGTLYVCTTHNLIYKYTSGTGWATYVTLSSGSFSDPTTTKGDLIVHGASTTRLAVGTDGQILEADSGQTAGVKWQGGAWQTYTPTITVLSGTAPTLGTSPTQTGRYIQHGKTVFVQIHIKFGSSGVAAGTGTYAFLLPVTAATAQVTDSLPLGSFEAFDSSASPGLYNGVATFDSGSDATHVLVHANGASGVANNLTNAFPVTWAAGDHLWISGHYEAAAA